MLELYKSEMQRLGKGTAIGLLVLFVGYYAAPRFALWEILHRNMGFILTVGAIGLSLCFGILHGILWRKKNFWIFLIHRPLKPARIYTSLLGAGVTVILGTLFLSLFITTLNYDLFTDKVVDTRHYLFAIYTALLSIACYMIGTLTVLHRSKFVFLAFYPLALTFFPEPQNAVTQYLPLLGFLAALFYLNLQCFKADLNKPIKSALGTGLLASATSYGLVIGLIMLTMVIYHVPLMLMGQHPDANPQDGSMKAMWLDNGENAIAYLLEESDHPRASHYALQATMAERRSVPTRGWKAPRRHQLHRFDNADAIYNPEQGDVWKFSHDEMLLIGTSALTGKSIGAIGLNGPLTDVSIATPSDRFEQVPHLSGGRYVSTQEKLYTVDFDTNTLLLKHQVNEGEFYTSSLWVGDAGALISTNQHLYLFDQATLRDEFSTLIADHTVAYPESTLKADYAFYIPVADGYLLGFTGDDYHGFDRPGAEVFVTRLDGSFERLGGREFAIHDHPAWIRHYNFMVAPFIFASEELLMHSIDPYNDRFLSVGNLRAQTYPLQIIIMAVVLQGMSILALWLLARRDLLKTNLRRTWMGMVAVLGLPALLSYLILQPRTTRA